MYWNLVIVKELAFYFTLMLCNIVAWSLVWGAVIWIGDHAQ